MYRSLSSLMPKAADLVALEVEELAGVLMSPEARKRVEEKASAGYRELALSELRKGKTLPKWS